MPHLTGIEITIAVVAALLIGFSKTGMPNAGMFSVILMAMIFPTKASVGILLPMLITGDIVAVSYYRRTVVWKHLLKLIPWVLAGIVLGYLVLGHIDSAQLKRMIGILVVALIALHLLTERMGDQWYARFSGSPWFNGSMGGLAGFATMIGNAAGGVMSIYLLSKKLPKKEFIGTGAWFCLTVNVIKVPFSISLGLITVHTFLFNLMLAPVILIGTFIGIKVLAKIPQQYFKWIILVLSAVAAIDLIV